MKRISVIVVSTFLLAQSLYASSVPANKPTMPENLLVEYQSNPIGIDYIPQLSWQITSGMDNVLQSAYHLQIASSEEGLTAGKADVWDSGKVESSQSTGIFIEKLPLKSRTKYFWRVKIWDNYGAESPWSETSTFETAFLSQSDWHGGWIGYVPGMPGRVQYFKSTYQTPQEVKSARAYVSGLGFYELYINGRKVGDRVHEPAQSTYSKTVYYTTYDITDCLSEGPNTFVIAVAGGWMGSPRLRMQVEFTYADNSLDILNTDRFRSVTTGPTMYSTVFDGETYDARLESSRLFKPYDPPALMNKDWGWAHNTDDPVGKMKAMRMEPIRVVESLQPKLLGKTSDGGYVFDAGRNLAGWAAMKIRGNAGDVVTLRFAETLREDGSVNQDNLRNAKVTDTYITKGEGTEAWEPKFTYHGFRYFQVNGLSYTPAEEDFAVKVVRSDVKRISEFECSNSLLNDIDRMVVNTEASNMHSVPTDCPQRDERMGWLNDMTARIETAIYNFNLALFYPKFVADITDTQDEEGRITCVAPFRFGMRPADPVSAYLLIAEKCYEFYGNIQVIRENYDAMKKWVDYLASRTDADGIVDYGYYGDWCPPKEFLMSEDGSGVSKYTPATYMSTGYLYYYERLLAKMAGLIGRDADVTEYNKMAEKTKAAFNSKYWNEELGGYSANNQSCNAFALWLGMPDESRKARVVKNLADDVVKRGYHLSTGNLCTRYLIEMLTENDHAEEAYKVATQTTYPSWGFMLSKGATTLWERWEYLTGDNMNSHNHPMMGSIGSWFYKYILGIRTDFENPAFSRFTVKPYVMGDLTFAKGSVNTVKGPVRVDWNRKGKTVTLNVEVPCGTTAEVWVPGAKGPVNVGSGKHTFKGRI